MGSIARTRLGIQAGLLGGAVVAALFFFLDLARLEPLGTATALSARFLGPTGYGAGSRLTFPPVGSATTGRPARTSGSPRKG